MEELLQNLTQVTGLASLASLAWVFTDGVVSSAVTDGVKEFFVKKVRALSTEKALRENHPLLQTLRRAMLQATADWIAACRPDLDASPGLIKYLNGWLADERRLLQSPEAATAYPVPAYEALERLVARPAETTRGTTWAGVPKTLG